MLGALVGAPVVAAALAIVFTGLHGAFEGAATMGDVSTGGIGGAVLGFGIGLWLTLRRGGRDAGIALGGIAVAASFVVVAIVLAVSFH